jgi:hypothetical protein
MLVVNFTLSVGSQVGDTVDALELQGGKMFIPGQTQPLASYRHDAWTHAGHRCIQIECRAILFIQFEAQDGTAGPRIGPRPSLTLRGRYLFAGRERIARLTSTGGEWSRTGRNDGWPVVRIASASRD